MSYSIKLRCIFTCDIKHEMSPDGVLWQPTFIVDEEKGKKSSHNAFYLYAKYKAEQQGWMFMDDGRNLCPKCGKKLI